MHEAQFVTNEMQSKLRLLCDDVAAEYLNLEILYPEDGIACLERMICEDLPYALNWSKSLVKRVQAIIARGYLAFEAEEKEYHRDAYLYVSERLKEAADRPEQDILRELCGGEEYYYYKYGITLS